MVHFPAVNLFPSAMSWSTTLDSSAWPAALTVPLPGAPRTSWKPAACAQFPGLADALAATPQDPVHHAEGDVWTHTQMVVDTLLASPGYAALTTAQRGVVFYAALLHDMAKPQTTRQIGDRVGAPGHSARGAIGAQAALWERDVPFDLREQVARLVASHQVPFFAFDSRRAVHPEYTARLLAADCSVGLLCLLAEADMRGRVCGDKNRVLDEIALFAELAQELGCLDAPYPFPSPATRIAYFEKKGQLYPDERIFVSQPFEVVMLSGLPATGKSTWAAAHPEWPSVAYDDLREELGLAHGEGTGTVVHAADDRIREHLRARRPFVINATHLSRQMRRRTLARIREYGGHVRVVCFEASRAEVLARNSNRDGTLTNTKLLRMVERWETPGYDEVEFREVRSFAPRLRAFPRP